MNPKTDISDEDWNAWTAEVRTFVADKKEVLGLTQKQDGEDFDKDMFSDNFGDIVNYLSRGDKRMSMRVEYKKNILARGRNMATWPKRQGGGISMPAHQVPVINQLQVIYAEANAAYWAVLEENNAQHLEMQRSSKKDGGTDGAPYGNSETFVKARTASRIASFKSDIRDNLWANADNPELFSIAQPISRPYVPKEESAVVAEVTDESDEDEQV
tara:strand:+ start:435 stop:1076 length:642 start_codon:yes stop_codon:yes gene_type:complete